MPNPNELSAAQAAAAIAGGQLTATALAETCLNRIETLDARLKAWVYVDRDAVLADARAADQAVSDGKPLGPLHGVPVGLKDIYYTANIPTRAGSEVYKDFVPDFDATSLTLLRRAGAVMLGKAVTTEFCLSGSIADGEPVERGTHAGRQQQRVGGGGGFPDVSGGAGFADGWFGAAAGGLQWSGGLQANLRTRQ